MHTRQPLTEAEREQRRAEQRELVKASVEQLRRSDGWQAYLRARRAFHTYTAFILIGGRRRCVVLRPLSPATCRRRPSVRRDAHLTCP
jgi:hypothetical protein